MATPRRPLLGHLLVSEGLVTKAQLRDALRAQAAPPHPRFEQVLVDREVITQAQLTALFETYQRKYRLGPVLLEARVLTEGQLQRALQHQRKTGRRLGDTLLELNLVSERQMKEAVCRQFGFRFVDLDQVMIDPSLAPLVERTYARQHRVMPLTRTEDRLTVAVDDPTDLDVLESLVETTGSEIDVVTSTSASFWRAFARLYGGGGADALASVFGAEGSAPAGADPATGALRELEARSAATAKELADLQTAHAALLAERDASARALGDLGGRHAKTTRALAELQAAHEALRAERDANVRALADLEARHAHTLGALAELRATGGSPPAERPAGAPIEEPRADSMDAFSTLAILRRAVTRVSRAVPGASPPRPRPEAREEVTAPAAPREPEARHIETARALAELEAAYAVLKANREAVAQAFEDLDARHAETARALAELKTAHAALKADREAGAQALEDLEARDAETARALAELKTAHAALKSERQARAQTLEELDTGHAQTAGALAEVKAAHAALLAERETRARAFRDLETRHTETVRALADLEAAHQAMKAARADQAAGELEARNADLSQALARSQTERQANAEALRELRQRHGQVLLALKAAQEALAKEREPGTRAGGEAKARETTGIVAELRATSDAMRAERDAATRALAALEKRHAETTRALDDLRAAHDRLNLEGGADSELRRTAQQALKELKAAQDALVLEREAGQWAHQELQALRRQQEALRREHDAALRALRGGRP